MFTLTGLRGEKTEEEELEDHLWKLSSERRELYVLSADMVPRGILLVFFSSSSLLPPSFEPSLARPSLLLLVDLNPKTESRKIIYIVYPESIMREF